MQKIHPYIIKEAILLKELSFFNDHFYAPGEAQVDIEDRGYQFGDGITNMFWFSYGTLMIFLGYGKVSIQKWWKFFVPLMLIFFVLAAGALIVAIHTGF